MLPAVTCVYMYLMCAGERAEPADDAVERATGCSKGSLNDTTVQLCSILGGDTGAISALRILHLYMERLGCDFQVHSLCETLATPASFSISLLVSLCDTLSNTCALLSQLIFLEIQGIRCLLSIARTRGEEHGLCQSFNQLALAACNQRDKHAALVERRQARDHACSLTSDREDRWQCCRLFIEGYAL